MREPGSSKAREGTLNLRESNGLGLFGTTEEGGQDLDLVEIEEREKAEGDSMKDYPGKSSDGAKEHEKKQKVEKNSSAELHGNQLVKQAKLLKRILNLSMDQSPQMLTTKLHFVQDDKSSSRSRKTKNKGKTQI
ncbi:unnamed protein product [Lupinus luteus]|uniref:Uncharacterized protein n=1 Tax=Lupinus luteus TaxID=3873 RepID=A0AAV1YF32_LUPLU